MDMPGGANEFIDSAIVMGIALAVVGGVVVLGCEWLWEKTKGRK